MSRLSPVRWPRHWHWSRPVAMHRLLFRQHRLRILVSATHRLAYAGLVLLGVALVGVTVVVFDVFYGRTAAMLAGCVALVSFAILWMVLPLCMRAVAKPDG